MPKAIDPFIPLHFKGNPALTNESVESWMRRAFSEDGLFHSVVDEAEVSREVKKRSGFVNTANVSAAILALPVLGGAPAGITDLLFSASLSASAEIWILLAGAAGIPLVLSAAFFGIMGARYAAISRFVRKAKIHQAIGLILWMENKHGVLVDETQVLTVAEKMLTDSSYDESRLKDSKGVGWTLKRVDGAWEAYQSDSDLQQQQDVSIASALVEKDVEALMDAVMAYPPDSAATSALPAENPVSALPEAASALLKRLAVLNELLSAVPLTVEQKHVLTRAKNDSTVAVKTFTSLSNLRAEPAKGSLKLIRVLEGLVAEVEAVQEAVADDFEDELEAQTVYVETRSAKHAL